jgi:hypothetical protein
MQHSRLTARLGCRTAVEEVEMAAPTSESTPSAAGGGRGPAGAPVPRGRSTMSPTYRRWLLATTVGELVAFSVPIAVCSGASRPLRARAV